MHLRIIPNYPNYGVDENGDVYRIGGASRGRTSGERNYRVSPVIHPKGHLWYVQIRDADGARRRVRLDKIRESVMGLT